MHPVPPCSYQLRLTVKSALVAATLLCRLPSRVGESVAQVGVSLQPLEFKHADLAAPLVSGGRKGGGEIFVYLPRSGKGVVEAFCHIFCAFSPLLPLHTSLLQRAAPSVNRG